MTLAKLEKTIVAALEEIKARDIEVLNVTKITTLFDRMIIASGDSTRQTKAIANNVAEKVKAAGGTVYGIEGEQNGEWILVDLGDVLVHVMQAAVRAHYNLEELWAEAIRVNKASVARTSATRNKAAVEPPVVESEVPAKAASSVRKNRISKSERSPDSEG